MGGAHRMAGRKHPAETSLKVLPGDFGVFCSDILVEACCSPGTRSTQMRGTGGREEPGNPDFQVLRKRKLEAQTALAL